MNLDKYGEVVNGPLTYAFIASVLKTKGSILIGWTDGHGSHLDLLFTLAPHKMGNIQRGLGRGNKLFVSVIGRDTFGFEYLNREGQELYQSYVGEKLGMEYSVTTESLIWLIKFTIEELGKEQGDLSISQKVTIDGAVYSHD